MVAPWHCLLGRNAAKHALAVLGEARSRFRSEREKAKEGGTRCGFRPPRFKSRKRTVPSFRGDNGPGAVRRQGKAVRLPGTGRVRARKACRFGGMVRECTVRHDGVRRRAAVVCDIPEPEAKEQGAVVGVDVGLRQLATVHEGESVEAIGNPRPLKCALRSLRRVNRRIAGSRRIHGARRCSNRRERMCEEHRRTCARVSHLRMDAARKAAARVAKRSRLMCVQSLDVSGWMGNRRLWRSTADATLARFLELLRWKCRREGTRLAEAGRFCPSSKMRSAHGYVNAGSKTEQRWRCPGCGDRHDRDDDAAMILRCQGLAADAEGASDSRMAAVPGEASTRRIILH